MKAIIFLFLFFVSSHVYSSCIALKSTILFNGTRFIQNSDSFIIIKKNKIVATNERVVPSNCKTMVVPKSTILPGLIDSHSLIFATDSTYGTDYSKGLLENSSMRRGARLEMAKKKLQSYLNSGFTSIRDLGNSGRFLDIDLRNSKTFMAPRMFVSGPGITSFGGQFKKGTSATIVKREYDVLTAANQVERLMTLRIKQNADVIKLYGDNEPNTSELSQALLSKVVKSARKINLPVAIHATNIESISRAIESRPASIQHAFEATAKQLTLMAQNDIILVPTDVGELTVRILSQKIPRKLQKQFVTDQGVDIIRAKKRIKRAIKARTTIAFGSDFYFPIEELGIPFIKGVLSSLYSLNNFGLSIEKTLEAATRNGASLIQRSDLGRIEIGATADILVVKGDLSKSLSNIENIVLVIKDGKILVNKIL